MGIPKINKTLTNLEPYLLIDDLYVKLLRIEILSSLINLADHANFKILLQK
jgi:hypothetical protein